MTSKAAMEETTPGPGEWTLTQLISVLWRRRWLLVGVVLMTEGIALAVSLVLPKSYEATTSVLTPKEGAGGGLLGGLLGAGFLQQQFTGMSLPSLSLPSLTPNRDLLIGV